VAQKFTDAIVAGLEHDWRRWQVWVVHRATQPLLWCARRCDGTGQAINADSPGELIDLLEQEASR
jgi:hypothetical protein